MTLLQSKSRRAALVLIALAAGWVIAACGSSTTSTSASKTSSTTTSNASSRRATLVACLRQHGVTLPSRPPGTGTGTTPGGAPPFGGGGGRFFGGGAFRGNSKLAAAFRACGGTAGFRRGGPRFRISHTAVNNYVACIRKHGYPQMPNPNFSGKGPVFPASIRSNAKFQAASRDCASVLRPSTSTGGTSTSANG